MTMCREIDWLWSSRAKEIVSFLSARAREILWRYNFLQAVRYLWWITFVMCDTHGLVQNLAKGSLRPHASLDTGLRNGSSPDSAAAHAMIELQAWWAWTGPSMSRLHACRCSSRVTAFQFSRGSFPEFWKTYEFQEDFQYIYAQLLRTYMSNNGESHFNGTEPYRSHGAC
jgi:hypothetical protein